MEQLAVGNNELQALIKRAEQGDSPAFISLYDATSRLVFGLILRILGDRTSAEETLLDIYTQIWKKSAVYDPAMPPVEWLITLAHRSALARLHWSKRDVRKPEAGQSNAEPAMTVAPGPQQEARDLLQSIAPAQRELLERAYYGGFSCSELAAQMGKPVGAVKTLLRSGLNKLGELSNQASGLSADAGADGGKK